MGFPVFIFKESRSLIKISLKAPNSSLPSPLVVYALVNPLSQFAQSVLPIFGILNKVLNIEINVVMNIQESLQEYPLVRWFRQVNNKNNKKF